MLLAAALLSHYTLTATPVLAQNKTLYVYRNDGGFDAFFNEDVDSIVYSTVSDSLTYDQVAVQEIWTKNGVTRIPVDAIDSISFQTPQPLFRNNVFHLTRDVLSYVTNATQTELTFKSTTPASKRPVQGQVVISDYFDEPVTGVFAGKVTSVSRNGGDWVVTCGYVSFDEIFERVALVGKSVFCEENSAAAKRFAPKRSNDEDLRWWELADKSGSYIINNLGTLSLDIGKHITFKDKDPVFICTYSFYANLGYYKLTVDVESTHDITADFTFELGNKDELKNIKSPSISELVSKQADYDFLKNMAGIDEPSMSQRLLNGGPVWFIPICPAVIAGIRVFPYLQISGSLYAQVELPITLATSHGFTAYGTTASPFSPVLVPHTNGIKKPLDVLGLHFSTRFEEAKGTLGVNGSAEAGLGLTLFFKAGGALLQGSVTAKAGLSLNGDANISTDGFVGDEADGNGGMWNWYRSLADSKVSVNGQVKIEPKLEILKVDLVSMAKEMFLDDLPEFKWKSKPWEIYKAYLFPEFTAPEVMHSDFTQPQGTLVSSTVSRNILIPGKVGLRVNNALGKKVKEEYMGTYYQEKSSSNLLTMDISDLTPGARYSILPMFKWGENLSICAWPPTKLTIPLAMTLELPEMIVAVDETESVEIEDGWGDYEAVSMDETIAICAIRKETNNGKDTFYVDVTGKTTGVVNVKVRDKVSREEQILVTTVAPKDTGQGNISDMQGIEL